MCLWFIFLMLIHSRLYMEKISKPCNYSKVAISQEISFKNSFVIHHPNIILYTHTETMSIIIYNCVSPLYMANCMFQTHLVASLISLPTVCFQCGQDRLALSLKACTRVFNRSKSTILKLRVYSESIRGKSLGWVQVSVSKPFFVPWHPSARYKKNFWTTVCRNHLSHSIC